ncbi:hypothetical protein JCM24511_02176 [Saitozyma sp. JCM 24511]|nr:hypothetical protein JCM24511_02176 [Saitozyma sp. JCM 24511]
MSVRHPVLVRLVRVRVRVRVVRAVPSDSVHQAAPIPGPSYGPWTSARVVAVADLQPEIKHHELAPD